jgi:hypothetical protein
LQLIDAFVSLPDKVFEPACQTDVVYEEGAKDVAMSALTGINGTSLHTFHIGGSEMMIRRIPYLLFALQPPFLHTGRPAVVKRSQ